MSLLSLRSGFWVSVFLSGLLFSGCHSHIKKGPTANGPNISIAGDTTTDVKVIVDKVNQLETVNRLEDAITYLTSSLKRFAPKEKALLLNERGNVYFLKDDFENALSSYLAAVDMDSSNASYNINVAKAYEALESLTNASFFANKVLTLPAATDSEKATATNMIQRWDQIHSGH